MRKMEESNDYEKKLKRMQWRERERSKRIFNDKLRTTGIDKMALENQIREKMFNQQILQTTDVVFKQNLNFYNVQAIQREQLIKHQAYREAEHLRQIENIRLAEEQKLRNKQINEEALANVPSDIYHDYFNRSSR